MKRFLLTCQDMTSAQRFQKIVQARTEAEACTRAMRELASTLYYLIDAHELS